MRSKSSAKGFQTEKNSEQTDDEVGKNMMNDLFDEPTTQPIIKPPVIPASQALTSTDALSKIVSGRTVSFQIVMRVRDIFVPQTKPMCFVVLENDENYTIELASYEKLQTDRLTKNLAFGSVIKLTRCQGRIKGKYDKSKSTVGIKFDANSAVEVVTRGESSNDSSMVVIDSFAEVDDKNRRKIYSGKLWILTKTESHIRGTKTGIMFHAGDKHKNRASVFVETENSVFGSSVFIGQCLKFENASAKYSGEELWLTFGAIKHLKRGLEDEKITIGNIDEYVSPKRRKTDQKVLLNEDDEWRYLNCSFPGVELFNVIEELRLARWKQSISPEITDPLLLEPKLRIELSKIFHDDTVNEWILQNLYNITNIQPPTPQ
ncbi:hypothetical protein M3Y97_00366500 [Aphelenchoides bicaudatus]|nr:hypothetical protein M3Y97_00366500 [Aphelenchoides bicaudatus]